ncbi:MAG: acylphosphatase [Ignavibacteria bacterium]
MNSEIHKLEKSAVKITVSGRVQGVGYRYYVYHVAQALNLNGYAKNLFNGDVEIYAEGRKEFLNDLINKARKGPSHSYVEDIKIEWLEFKNKYNDFEIW